MIDRLSGPKAMAQIGKPFDSIGEVKASQRAVQSGHKIVTTQIRTTIF